MPAKPLYYAVLPAPARARLRPKKIAQGRKDLLRLLFFTVLMIVVLGLLEGCTSARRDRPFRKSNYRHQQPMQVAHTQPDAG